MSANAAGGVPSILEVVELLDRHERAAGHAINMVPSENSLSPIARLPLALDVYHRYFFNDLDKPDEWNFRGAEDVACLETRLAVPLLRELTGAPHVNLRSLSGLSAMTLILSSLGGPPGSTIVTVAPEQGGHYATARLAARLGLRAVFITGSDPHTPDFDALADMLVRERPTLVYIDQSNCLFPLDAGRLVETVRRVAPATLVHLDASHWLGLVLGGQMPNPLALGVDSFGGSTHKTFPGPQKAVFATLRADIAERVRAAQYFMISSHHFAATIALGIALLEFRDCDGDLYARRVVDNTLAMGSLLDAAGLPVVAAERGYSHGHQLWIDTAAIGLDGMSVSARLAAAGLRVNVLPDLPGLNHPAIRLGLNEATYHGLRRSDIHELAGVFAAAVFDAAPADQLRKRVADLRGKYRWPYSFVSREPDAAARCVELVSSAITGDTDVAVLEQGIGSP